MRGRGAWLARREEGAYFCTKPTSNAATPGWIGCAWVTYFWTDPNYLF